MAASQDKGFREGFEGGTLNLLLDKTACRNGPQRRFEIRCDKLNPKDGSNKYRNENLLSALQI